MAKRDSFVTIETILRETNHTELADVIAHEIELLDKKRSTGNSKAKAETVARAEKVYTALAGMDKPVTISELIKQTTDVEVAEYSVSRVSALLRKLGDKVVREEIKGKAYFSVS